MKQLEGRAKPTVIGIGGLAVTALATFATYLCVSGSASIGEAAYGVAVAALSTLTVAAAMRLAGVRQRLEPRWLARLAAPCLDVVTQIAPLTVALLAALGARRSLCATTASRRFDPGQHEDPVAAGRRSLVAIGLSIAPASLICERDLDCHEVVVASIGLKPRPEGGGDPCWPL